MKVRLKSILAGPQGNYSPGIHDLPEVFANELIYGGYADALRLDQPIPAIPVSETAMIEAAGETAVIPRAKGRGGKQLR